MEHQETASFLGHRRHKEREHTAFPPTRVTTYETQKPKDKEEKNQHAKEPLIQVLQHHYHQIEEPPRPSSSISPTRVPDAHHSLSREREGVLMWSAQVVFVKVITFITRHVRKRFRYSFPSSVDAAPGKRLRIER
jgi:hypothetical protein